MAKRLTVEQLVDELSRIDREIRDPEVAHTRADEALLKYINKPAVSDAFKKLTRWYA